MSESNVVHLPRLATETGIPQTTYGALAESDISALEALLGEVKRTNAHVMWLEHYISELDVHELFGEQPIFHPQQEVEWERTGQRPKPNTLAWTAAVERAKQLGIKPNSKRQPQTHLALAQLLNERRHLVTVCVAAIRAGVALDEVEMAKAHGELIVNAMLRFAKDVGMDLTDKAVIDKIVNAIENLPEMP